ncbi:MAG: DUF2723 domain-containing protein [Candidatus Zixiibacteriota bacterium]
MTLFQNKSRDWAYIAGGAVVFLTSLIVYLMTVQRTIPFWDCGEYIACSYILGIAHPPGNPLFLLIGRIFSMLPIATDISYRVNLLSVFSSAAAATMGYVVSVRLLRFFPGVSADRGRLLLVYLCSVTGALLFAFGRTNWSNSVEAEVYAIAMTIYFALIWLSLRWYDNRDQASSMKYLIMIAYLSLLSVAVHMTSFLAMPAIFLFVISVDERLRKDIRFWLSGIVLFTVAANVSWFLVLVPVWMVISLIGFLQKRDRAWALALGLSTAAMIGFSAHAYIPIRAAEKPAINQNNPADWERFYGYLQRKQYGSESMFEKMFTRRATWEHQLGDFPRIGFGGFLMDQFGFGGILFTVPLILAIIGIIALIKWKWRVGTFFALILFAGTIGLVLYMNFADGSMVDLSTGLNKLEVRDRDYFFTPGFITFALYIGMGLFVALNFLLNFVKQNTRVLAASALGIVTFVFPAISISANYNFNNRSNNFLPYDYAYNYLMSCPPDAILFTGGDNDTFPLWCLQEVYGVRRDVRIANLSLIQTDWYQLQLKYEMGVPIALEDDQMKWESLASSRPRKPYVDHLRGGWEHLMMAYRDQQTGQVVTVAHQMVEQIIGANQWKYPILFSGSLPTEVKYPLADHNVRRGWLYQVVPQESKGLWDKEVSTDLFMNVYRTTGIDDPKVFREEVATTLIIGAVQSEMSFVDYLEATGDTALALTINDDMIRRFPEFWQSYTRMARIRGFSAAETDSMYEEYFKYIDRLIAFNPDNIYYYQYKALGLQYLGRGSEAIRVSEIAYKINPVTAVTFQSLATLYIQNGRREDALRIAREYLRTNPGDQAARAISSGQF